MTRHGILVGVDGSPAAGDALRWAVSEGLRRDTPVTALLAWSFLDQHDPDRPGSFDPTYGEDDAAAALSAFVADAVGPDHEVHLRLECDRPVGALAEAGAAHELLVVGARGAGGFAGLALGSTSDGVLEHAPHPVAVVRGPAGDGPVVAELDEDELADDVVRAAVDAACRRGGRLVLISVYDQPSFAGWVFEQDAPFFARLARRRETFLDEIVARVDTRGLDIERRVTGGNPSGVLLEAERELDASLVVVAGRRSHQVARHAAGVVYVVG